MATVPLHQFTYVQIGQIDLRDSLTDFSLGPPPDSLLASIRAIGVTHPLALTRRGSSYQIVAGHRRARLAKEMGLQNLSANMLPDRLGAEDMLAFNLMENTPHRQFSDVEKGAIVLKLAQAGASEQKIIDQYMPLLGLERSKKLLRDCLEAGKFPPGLKTLLHELNIPLRVFGVLFRWDDISRRRCEEVFGALRPGVGKFRDLLELIDETSQRDGEAPGNLLSREEVAAVTAGDAAPPEKYERLRQIFFRWRYPNLNDLRKEVWLVADKLNLGGGTRLTVPENFESGELKIEIRFKAQEDLMAQAASLSEAAASSAMKTLITLVQKPE